MAKCFSLFNFQNIILLLTLFPITGLYAQQSSGVSINENYDLPHPSAIFDVQSEDRGMLVPRMTTAERDGINNPAEGLIIFNTTTNCPNYFSGGFWYEWCGLPPAQMDSIDCSGATLSINGTLTEGISADGISIDIGYTNGNGGTQNGQTVSSTGVTGLTATLQAGNFAVGSGTLVFHISGIPANSGIATFALNIGGQTCDIEIPVSDPFVCGVSTVTFTYNGSTVTYGTVVGHNGRCWLDRNLGASQVANSIDDTAAYGDLFQWGRGDDGHQSRTSPVVSGSLSAYDQPGHNYFILSQVNSGNWRAPHNHNLWQGVDGINNPCPNGWRLPDNTEWDIESGSWTTSNGYYAGAFDSPLKLTITGYRSSSAGHGIVQGLSPTISNPSSRYWSSTVNGPNSYFFYIQNSFVYLNDFYRAMGHAVRCIKD